MRIAHEELRSFIERILYLKGKQDEFAADIREVYAEANGRGFNKTVLGQVVAHLRKVEKKGHDEIAEQESIFDLYLNAYQGSHAHAREGHGNQSRRANAAQSLVAEHGADESSASIPQASASAGYDGSPGTPSADAMLEAGETVASRTASDNQSAHPVTIHNNGFIHDQPEHELIEREAV